MKKALLINPPSGMYIRDDRCQVPVKGLSSSLRTPLDLAYMAAVLEEKNLNCVIRDYPAEGKGWEDFRQDLRDNYDILVISVTTPTVYVDVIACDIAKRINPEILTVAKGAHFAAEDMEIMEIAEGLDVAIRGEYELVIKDIAGGTNLDKISGITYRQDQNVKRNPDRAILDNMEILPFPARHLLNNKLYTRPDTGAMMTSIQTNRGCPARCVYCLVRSVSGSKIRARSPEGIASEMEICKKDYGIKDFYFRADTFTYNKDWMIEVCKRIVDKKLDVNWVCNSRVDTIDEDRLKWLKAAGCWMIGFGIESGDQDILDKMKKGTTLQQAQEAVSICSKFNMKSYLFWVLGLPWETEESLVNTLKFAKKIKGDFAEFHIAYPFPGTEFYNLGLKKNLFDKKSLYKGDVKAGIVKTFSLPKERLVYYQKKMTRSYYLSPWRIIKLLKGVRSWSMLVNYIQKGFSVLFSSCTRQKRKSS